MHKFIYLCLSALTIMSCNKNASNNISEEHDLQIEFKIEGEKQLLPNKNYLFDISQSQHIPNDVYIEWSLYPETKGKLEEGQGSKTVTFSFNNNVSAQVKAVMIYPSGDKKNIGHLDITASFAPLISDISMFKYCQDLGEFSLFAKIPNTPHATVTWSCTGDAVLYDFQYPNDASFSHHPNLYKAIDFYSEGSYYIEATAKANDDENKFSKHFYIKEAKKKFPVNINSKSLVRGENAKITINDLPLSRGNVSYDIDILQNQKLIKSITQHKTPISIETTNLEIGTYNISIKTHNKTYFTTLTIK